MAPPFRADQIGSLLRPESLLKARESLASPSQMYSLEISDAAKAAEKEAICDVVQTQIQRSIRPITDGEYPRHIYYAGFFEKLAGFEARPNLPIPDAFRTDFPTTTLLARNMGATTRAACVCTSKIAYERSPYLDEWLTLRGNLREELWGEAKFTLPAPNYQHIQLRPGTAWTPESGYQSDEEYFVDLAACYAAEMRTLYEAGLRNIQIDDPHLTYFCSSMFLDGCARDGTDTDVLLDLYLKTHNRILAAKPAGLRVGMHLCRGNMSGSTHWVSGSYERIARKLFVETSYDTYYLEFDDVERVGGFEPLRFLPGGKNVVLGIVSTKTAELENIDTLEAKVREAAKIIAEAQGVSLEEALDCLAVSPQCGFSSSSLAGGKDMTMEIMWDKLDLVKKVAERVWPSRS
ncbi:UROD/MetE-like protein [Xylariomycetidae sp. FL2044]|nr:UROD/MetE-like protein [Xylariomycetidae sp. FL2044]